MVRDGGLKQHLYIYHFWVDLLPQTTGPRCILVGVGKTFNACQQLGMCGPLRHSIQLISRVM